MRVVTAGILGVYGVGIRRYSDTAYVRKGTYTSKLPGLLCNDKHSAHDLITDVRDAPGESGDTSLAPETTVAASGFQRGGEPENVSSVQRCQCSRRP